MHCSMDARHIAATECQIANRDASQITQLCGAR
jgi:hypothetical protein